MRVDLNGYLRSKIMPNIPKAQYMLDTQIMNDTVPYMPMQTGTFINTVRIRSASLAGSGVVCVATGVMGRYLYYGKKMVDSQTGKGPRMIPIGGGEVIFRYRKGARLVPSSQPLTYSNPNATPEWYETAKSHHYRNWQETVKRVLINGK